jgi:hypothetical protein
MDGRNCDRRREKLGALYEEDMKPQMSRRGEAYLATARSLLHAARSMTDMAVAGRLEALANDYQLRAEKASSDDARRASSQRASSIESEQYT